MERRDEAALARIVGHRHALVATVCRRELGPGDGAAAAAVLIILAQLSRLDGGP